MSAFGQSNDLAVTFGGYFPISGQFSGGNAFAIEGNFGHRIFHVPLASVYLEVPITAVPSSGPFVASNGLLSLGSYSALFVTPGLRLKLAPGFPISPYFAVGGGLAHFSQSGTAFTSSTSSNSGTADFAGGLDMKVFPYLSLRAEVRDYYSGSPFSLPNFSERQNQLLTTGGIVLRF